LSSESQNLPSPTRVANPEDYRMTFGQHLDELRGRLIKALLGFLAAFVLCLVFSRQYTIPYFCKPLLDVLRAYEINPQLYALGASDAFMVYIRISLITAAAIAAPWIAWQAWGFIAAGLYPSERKMVTKYLPLSLGLLVGGMAFVYWVVLPFTLNFFLMFSATIPLPSEFRPASLTTTQPVDVATVPILKGDPPKPVNGQWWFDESQQRLKMYIGDHVRVIQFGPENLLVPLLTLPEYISLVMLMLVTFGLAFQLPIVVVALATLGIFSVTELKGMRKQVYFIIVVLASVLTPGDVITLTIALVLPLILLYELGIWLASGQPTKSAQPA
jgi:sec-independent protein translocase protein TatC